MMRLPSRWGGKAGELLGAAWLRRLGFKVTPPLSGDHDRVVNGHKIEFKMSTLWEQGNCVFQQFRDQDYEYAFLLGISPTIATRGSSRRELCLSGLRLGMVARAARTRDGWPSQHVRVSAVSP
jgi:hypothetical protein